MMMLLRNGLDSLERAEEKDNMLFGDLNATQMVLCPKKTRMVIVLSESQSAF